MVKTKIGVERFIRTYMKHYKNGGNQSTIARELNVTSANVCQRIKHLVKSGVKLPKMGKKNYYDVDRLNKIVENLC